MDGSTFGSLISNPPRSDGDEGPSLSSAVEACVRGPPWSYTGKAMKSTILEVAVEKDRDATFARVAQMTEGAAEEKEDGVEVEKIADGENNGKGSSSASNVFVSMQSA